jgi:hypothetical protein
MKSIPEAQLRNDASLAAYYGVVLAAAGDTASAREYLALSSTAKLLPEEKALVAKAQSNVK